LLPLIIAHQKNRNDVVFVLAKQARERAQVLNKFIPDSWTLEFRGRDVNNPFSHQVTSQIVRVSDLCNTFCEKLQLSLPHIIEDSPSSHAERWMLRQFQEEFKTLHNNNYNEAPFSILKTYPRLVQQAGRLSRG